MNDRQEIERAIESFIAAYNAGDLAGVVAYYASDLVKVRQGAAPESKAEIEQRLAEVFRQFESRVEVETEEIVTVGEMAYTRGRFEVTLRPRTGGEPQRIRRRFLEIWRKVAGRWVVARTMDNAM